MRRSMSAKKPLVQTNVDHYQDFDYYRRLHEEVKELRGVLEADFKNQRIIDLENRIKNNKRIIVTTLKENIFQLRFGFEAHGKRTDQTERDELL